MLDIYFNQRGSLLIHKNYTDDTVDAIVILSPDVSDFILQLSRASNYSDSVISAMKAAVAEAEDNNRGES